MCNINYLKFPCRICGKDIHGKNKAVQCDLCELWIRIKCNNLNYFDYRYLQNCNESWSCIECCRIIFPFKTLSCNKCFLACSTSTDTNNIQWKDVGSDHNSSLLLKPLPNLELLVNQFNNATLENSNYPENMSSSKCYEIDGTRNIKIALKRSSLPFL